MQRATAKKLAKDRNFPDKLFYKIGEVSKITDIEPYVLRYWETEFPFLKPRKNKSGQRVYVKKDVELIFSIKDLLYTERYTIEGVRKRFGESHAGRRPATAAQAPAAPAAPAAVKAGKTPSAETIELVKKRLRNILAQLD